jgi:AcrR family transcriptional regulator
MSRWEPNARERLTHAAMELYRERGFDQTTVAEIADRAGLTERTFFRYFADKREVLFSGQDRVLETYVTAIAGAPETATPMDMVAAALDAVTPVFHELRDFGRQRYAVIVAHPELQERELLKRAALAAGVAEALRQRGVAEPAASLAAEAGVIAFKTAYARWASDPDAPDLPRLIHEAFGQLHAISAPAAARLSCRAEDHRSEGGARDSGDGCDRQRRC